MLIRPISLAVVLLLGYIAGLAVADDPTDQLPSSPPIPERTQESQPSNLSPAERQLRDRLRETVAFYRGKVLNSRDHSPWEVMHAIVAQGVDTQIHVDGPDGEKTTAIGWLCFNKPCRSKQLFYLSRGRFNTRQGPGLEGHQGQFLAMLAQSRVKPDYPIRIDDQEFTVADLIKHEKRTCHQHEELTFKLIGLNHYLDLDETWECDAGQTWDIERLVKIELAQPVRGAACGGTHRLVGISLAVRKRIEKGQPLTGEFVRAKQYIRQYHRYALSLQNRDGSFSTNWFRGREAQRDVERRLRTTGHVLEWLLYSLPDSEVRMDSIRRATDYLVRIMDEGRSRKWDNGPLGHALHALILYDQRVFRPLEQVDSIAAAEEFPGPRPPQLR